MQILRSQIIGRHIFTIQGGYDMAIISNSYIQIKDLNIIVFQVSLTRASKQPHYLLPTDIRQITTQRLLIDHDDKLSLADELVRLTDTIKTPFLLINLIVETVSGKKLGKIVDYSFDDQFFVIKKLYVSVRIWDKVFTDQLIIDRNDIVDVIPKKVVVRDGYIRNKQTITNALPANPS